jgi:hypothetical protein
MSLLAETPVCAADLRTDLGDAFDAHVLAHRGDPHLALGYPETSWLNVMRTRAGRQPLDKLKSLTDKMLALLANPNATPSFKNDFLALYDEAGRHAYPLAWTLRDERHAIADITSDYTLLCFDSGIIRTMEDTAVSDPTVRSFVDQMLRRLRGPKNRPRHEIFPGIFEIYPKRSSTCCSRNAAEPV